jgi:hypothetical protein
MTSNVDSNAVERIPKSYRSRVCSVVPLNITSGAPTLVIRRAAYEKAGLVRASVDAKLGLTADEFRVEGDLVVIGPVHNGDAFSDLLQQLEDLGLTFYDDFFELSGNWPEWLGVLAASLAGGRSNPSQPQR